MTNECPFCQIAENKINVHSLYEDAEILAFDDIDPKAPHHVLVIPRRHIATLNELTSADAELIGKMILVAKNIAAERGVAETGYRLLFNCNKGGGQAVFHIHLHLLGGRQMQWPPG